jgi:tetratricopeptide (TPR) repeat protein
LDPSTLASLYSLFGATFLKAGKFDESERLLAASISDLEHAIGVNDLLVAKQLLLLGFAYEGQGKYLDAEAVLSRGWSVLQSKLGDDHSDTAQAMLNLARMYISLGRHDDAEPLLQKALRVFEEEQAPGSNVGVVLNGLGLVHSARGLYAQALTCFERALEIFQTVHGPEFPDCATVLRNMAVSLQKIGEERRAKDALEQARQIDRKQSPAKNDRGKIGTN